MVSSWSDEPPRIQRDMMSHQIPMVTFLASLAVFVLLHARVEGRGARLEIPFHRSLRLSRGLVSVLLVAIGFSTLAAYFDMWPRAFLAGHVQGSLPGHLVMVICGHFAADLIWLAWGWIAHDSVPRKDLIVHHLIGGAACGAALYWQVGYLLVAIGMTTELMPVATGLGAWGKVKDSLAIERFAVGFSIASLLLWRLPFWFYALVIFGAGWVQARVPDLPPAVTPIALLVAGSLVVMDVYWTHQLWASFRELQAEHRSRKESTPNID